MYDLFGDLPLAKKGTSSTACTSSRSIDTNVNESTDNRITSKTDSSATGDNIQSTNEDKNKENTSTAPPSAAPTTVTTKTKTTTASMSIVQSLGNAGKTTSFIPLALRKKRPIGNTNTGNNVTGASSSSKRTSSHTHTTTSHKGTTCNDNIIIGGGGSSSISEIKTDHVEQSIIRNHHTIEIQTKHNPNNTTAITIHNDNDENNPPDNSNTDDEYTEPEELQKLHSSVHPYEMYNPNEPNDYLTYRKNKKNEVMQKDLERQVQKTLELQQQLRSHIEEERKKILESGDVNKIIETSSNNMNINSMGRGGGRGRGMNNIPAWLAQKQKEQEGKREEQQSSEFRNNVNTSPQQDCQFEDTTNGVTVVLTNMVDVGDVDDELQDEVKVESEMKCGKVVDVKIIEDKNEVKVFVTFENPMDANKAPAIFDGRMFGQRRISAKLL